MTGVRKMPLISVVVVYMVGLILHCLRYTLSFESFLTIKDSRVEGTHDQEHNSDIVAAIPLRGDLIEQHTG